MIKLVGSCSEEELTVARDDPLTIKVQLDPEPSQGGLKYVHACLALSTSQHYPEVAAQCSLQDVKGTLYIWMLFMVARVVISRLN